MTKKQNDIIAPNWAWEESINDGVNVLAKRMSNKAVDHIKHGKPGKVQCSNWLGRGAIGESVGVYYRWTGHGHDVSNASKSEAFEAARYAVLVRVLRVVRKIGHWPVSWSIEFANQLRLVAWRASFASLTRLDGGLTGAKVAHVRCNSFDNVELLRRLSSVAACFIQDKSGDRAQHNHKQRVKRAKSIIWFRLLGAWLDDSGRIKQQPLNGNQRTARAAAVRRYKLLCQLLDGHGVGLRSDKLHTILTQAGITDNRGRGRRKNGSLSAQLVQMPSNGGAV